MKAALALLCAALFTGAACPAFADGGGWQPVANAMMDGRWAPAACVLPDGKSALIVGGFSYTAGACVATADCFQECTRRFVPCRGRLTYPRDFASATRLPNGTVLIAGGYNTVLGTLDTAEVYDPARDTFHVLPSRLAVGRELFTATPLTDGRILYVGGFDTHRHRTQASADLFDPRTGTFTPAPSFLATDRFGHDAVRLADGRVLIVGGTQWQRRQPTVTLASAEIFDPRTGLFHTTTGGMSVPRDRPTATLLPDGRILVAGGQNSGDGPRFAELFDPRTETFAPLPSNLTVPRMAHSDVTLPDGRVLLAGGWSPPLHSTTATTELFHPSSQTFVPGPPMPADGHDLALLVFPDGGALAAGGKQARAGYEGSLATGAFWQSAAPGAKSP